MCNMKIEAMDRAGETGEIHSTNYYDIDRNRPVVPRTALPAQYDASAVMAATRLMVDLGRTIDGAGTTTMISQAAAMLGALGRLPVVDIGVHVALTKVLRGELAAKEAECAELASRINTPVAGSVGDDARFKQLLQYFAASCTDDARLALVAYIDSRTARAPSVDRNAVLEEAIRLCDQLAAFGFGAMECSKGIRALKSAAPVAQPLAASAVSGAQSHAEWVLRQISQLTPNEGNGTAIFMAKEGLAAAAPRQGEQPAVRAVTDEQKDRIRDALSVTLGDAMDCTRTWSAWRVGTMTERDFELLADNDERLDELVEAAINALAAPSQQPAASEVTK
jgi:hypothetical protein